MNFEENFLTSDSIDSDELFHAFGADDIYSMENGVRAKPKAIKTIMDTDYGDGTSKLSPNDVKCLISLYQEKKNSKDEQEKYLDEMNEFLQEYEKEYYSTFANKCKEKTNYGYTFDEPNIIVNPYGISPLTALILFETEEEYDVIAQRIWKKL